MIDTTSAFLTHLYDCLLLVHRDIQVLDRIAVEIQERGIARLNIGKELSTALINVSVRERGRFSRDWLMDTLRTFETEPVLLTHADLLFEPSFELDPLTLFRQASKVKRLIVLWPGDYISNVLSYAVPEHHHFRTWPVNAELLQQPLLVIQNLSSLEGA